MICNFTSFSTVFQSYQDDGGMIMIEKILASGEALTHNRQISRPALSPLSYRGSVTFIRAGVLIRINMKFQNCIFKYFLNLELL